MGRTIAPAYSIGSRSRLFSNGEPHDPMNQALDRMARNRARDVVPKMLAGTSPDSLPDLVQRQQLAAGDKNTHAEFLGLRSDMTGGWGPRCRVGLLPNGEFGVMRWSETGTFQIATWVAP